MSGLGNDRPRSGPLSLAGGILAAIGGLFVAAIGAVLIWGGAQLIGLGGSWYYLLAGAALVASGVLLALRKPVGGILFGVTLWATLIWSLWEAGFAFWPLLPRVFSPLVIAVVVMLVLLAAPRAGRRPAMILNGAGAVTAALILGVALFNQFSAGVADEAKPQAKIAARPEGDWRHYGRDARGTRFAPFDQINAGNVENLKVAWTFRTGEIASGGSEDQNTPSQIGDTVYVCTPKNQVIALDADTGREKWRHNPQIRGGFWNRCRGVGYYETAAASAPGGTVQNPPQPLPLCARRIISTTIDARMFALDAATGQRCPDFGVNGEVSLREGMGEIKRGFYFQTSQPTVARGLVIIGGWVQDNSELNEPSGVVRAFSAETGELAWAFDLGNPAITKLPPPGGTYTRGTPNMWSTPAVDEELGLVYLPTGNATPDYWGSHRSDIADQYSSSVVALDIATGRERWKYQTVHHDVWDYDVPSQPMLLDLPGENGQVWKALIQLTKRGQIFVLDRQTGEPIDEVVELLTPQGPAPGEWVTPTQPYSVMMPHIGYLGLNEKMMWGITPIDQMLCRIAFRKLRYEGDFTPPGTSPTLQYPGNGGGQNWGSGSYDATRNYLIVNEIRNPIKVTLLPSKDPGDQLHLAPNRSAKGKDARPYQSRTEQFMSPLEVPCLQPPMGTMTAIDLTTRKIVWQVPTGTAETSGPTWPIGKEEDRKAWETGLKVPVGTPGPAGSFSTAGGLVFHSATTDPYLRAYDTGTGKLLWQGRLPVGSGSTPMTYVSPKTGKQYVVVNAGGARRMPARGDYIVAYALPD
jgi:quinate dehydrogenase (quinone)